MKSRDGKEANDKGVETKSLDDLVDDLMAKPVQKSTLPSGFFLSNNAVNKTPYLLASFWNSSKSSFLIVKIFNSFPDFNKSLDDLVDDLMAKPVQKEENTMSNPELAKTAKSPQSEHSSFLIVKIFNSFPDFNILFNVVLPLDFFWSFDKA